MRNPEAFVQSISDVMTAFRERKLRPHIGKVFPLEEVNLNFFFFSSFFVTCLYMQFSLTVCPAVGYCGHRN